MKHSLSQRRSCLFTMMIFILFGLAMTQGVSHVNFEPKEFAYLNITRISSQLVRKDIECGFACLEITSCFSYNLAAFPDANGKLSCELLPSDKYNNSDKLIYSPIFNHFSIPNPLFTNHRPSIDRGV
ncbi:uncharacterized protein LOC113681084 [Pocillopora damicornis]|uniref:uncharacterized protein LOC113681084 n=1 Tax=Pocillopora damicornis TaxID=46731 RepID=UPI000F55760C|nr:uncharacterized protein LOC113681084 [Pocillopora damicornis]